MKKEESKPYHELSDCSKKLLRICIQAKLLPQSGHQVYLAITDRFNSSGEFTRECYEGAAGLSRKTGIGKKQTTDVANRLAELSFLTLKYRVWLNNSKQERKDFEKFEDAINFQKEKGKDKSWNNQPTLVRVYSEPNAIPTPKQLGLTLKNPKDHIYWAPEHLRWTALKKPRGILEKNHTPTDSSDIPPTQKSELNDTNTNETKSNVTKGMNFSNIRLGEDVPSPPLSGHIKDLITAFKKRFKQEFDRELPDQQVSFFLQDADVLEQVEKNIAIILGSGGSIDSWVKCEFNRMQQHIHNGKYRTPKLIYFKNNKSLEAYLDLINGDNLKKSINPFSHYFSAEEFKQCLTVDPSEDLTLIKYQVIINAYAEKESASEIHELAKLLTDYSDFLKPTSKTFMYVGIKYLSKRNSTPDSIIKLANKFSTETNNPALLQDLLRKDNIELIAKAKKHLAN